MEGPGAGQTLGRLNAALPLAALIICALKFGGSRGSHWGLGMPTLRAPSRSESAGKPHSPAPTSGAVPCPAMYPEGQRQGIGKGQGVNNEATLLVGLRQAPLVGRGHEQSRLAVPSCGIIGAP